MFFSLLYRQLSQIAKPLDFTRFFMFVVDGFTTLYYVAPMASYYKRKDSPYYWVGVMRPDGRRKYRAKHSLPDLCRRKSRRNGARYQYCGNSAKCFFTNNGRSKRPTGFQRYLRSVIRQCARICGSSIHVNKRTGISENRR